MDDQHGGPLRRAGIIKGGPAFAVQASGFVIHGLFNDGRHEWKREQREGRDEESFHKWVRLGGEVIRRKLQAQLHRRMPDVIAFV